MATGNKPPAGHPGWVIIGQNKAGENIWGPPGTTPTAAQKNSGGTKTASKGKGGGGGGGDGEAKTPAEKWKQSLLANYRSYIGDTDAPMPAWMKKLKYEDREKYTAGWLKAKYDEMGYLPKKQMEKYRAALSMKVQEWLGVHYKPGDKEIQRILDEWSKTDPDKRGTSDFQLFVKQKLSKTKAFQAAFPGYDKFIKSYQENFGVIPLPDQYLALKQEYIGVWEKAFGLDVAVDDAFIEEAIQNAWSPDKFTLALKASEAYKGTAGQQAIIARFNNLWDAMFKGTKFEAVRDQMAEKYRLTGMTFDEFFDLQLQQNKGFESEFYSMFPEYEAYRNNMQVENPGAYISIETFMQRREELRDIFQETLENYDITIPPELLSKALSEGWEDARLEKYLKESPDWRDVYMKTNDAKVKAIDFNQYWMSIFGRDVPVDPSMLSDFVVKGSGDPTEYFEQIRQTPAFQQQYGMWDEFEAAQTAAGYTSKIIENPEIYKQYREAMVQAFAEIGEKIPEGYERMYFSSGIDPDNFGKNLEQWYNQEKSYTWETGDKANMATAAGIANKTEGGNLRNRMQKALAQHRQYAQSKFNSFSTTENAVGKITSKI